jgi:hypothetical protein
VWEIEVERGRTSARALWGGKQVGTRGKSTEKVKRKTEREGKHACMSGMNRQIDGYIERQCDASKGLFPVGAILPNFPDFGIQRNL